MAAPEHLGFYMEVGRDLFEASDDSSGDDTEDLATLWHADAVTDRAYRLIERCEAALPQHINSHYALNAVHIRGKISTVRNAPIALEFFDGTIVQLATVLNFTEAALLERVCGLLPTLAIEKTQLPREFPMYKTWRTQRKEWRAKQLVPLPALDATRARVYRLENDLNDIKDVLAKLRALFEDAARPRSPVSKQAHDSQPSSPFAAQPDPSAVTIVKKRKRDDW